jgi:ferredoxin
MLLCDCGKTMTIDREALAKSSGNPDQPVFTSLCASQQAQLISAMAESDAPVMIACTQYQHLFESLAEDHGRPMPQVVNIRERAGWSDDGKKATPKMAALIALAEHQPPPVKLISMTSYGRCLIYGGGDAAIALAKKLSADLGVTVMLSPDDAEVMAESFPFTLTTGVIKQAQGHFTNFTLTIDHFAEALPHSRAAIAYGPMASGVESQCDMLIDLTGNTPLFTGWQKRDGYFRADPDDISRLAEIENQARTMIGDFEKPIYVTFDENLCAHSRNSITGCSKCLDVCPAGAITSIGDTVAIDPGICGGCGYCGAVCPSGAAQTNLLPIDETVSQIALMGRTYHEAGGKAPDLLIHDGQYGLEVINTLARFGKGLPAHVIPYEMHAVGRTGHDILLGAIASGFQRVMMLVNPQKADDAAAITPQITLAEALLKGAGVKPDHRFQVIDDADPDKIEAALWQKSKTSAVKTSGFMALGAPRAVTRLAMRSLISANGGKIDTPIPLPQGAPYGRVEVNTTSCTVCLSCVGACPAGALQDNPDAPQLLFKEDACLQCGICVATCPEKVITLVPQFNLSDQALSTELIVEDAPFHCTACGKPFGTTRSIEAIVGKLSGHSMFADSGRLDMLKMCEDCRVDAIFSEKDKMLDIGDRKKPRTTDDYLN